MIKWISSFETDAFLSDALIFERDEFTDFPSEKMSFSAQDVFAGEKATVAGLAQPCERERDATLSVARWVWTRRLHGCLFGCEGGLARGGPGQVGR